jgi:hypothetical protein
LRCGKTLNAESAESITEYVEGYESPLVEENCALRFLNLQSSKKRIPGLPVDIDVAASIERVFVSPTAESCVANVVERELELHGYPGMVVHSTLYSKHLD